MKKLSLIITLFALLVGGFTACDKDGGDEPYILKKEDIQVTVPQGGFKAVINTLFRITVTSVSDEEVSYQWLLDGQLLDGQPLVQTKDLEHMFEMGGEYELRLVVSQGDVSYDYDFTVAVEFGPIDPTPAGATAYITKILDYMPAVGQFTNELPAYVDGDTQETMNAKVLNNIGNNKRGMISLGGFGGYVVVGFDHTIANVAGKRDFRVIANAFYADANPDPDAPLGGSCEPGVIVVSYDANRNGEADDPWYEIAGSAHEDPTKELWYQMAADNGNDVSLRRNYSITYHRPEKEPDSPYEWDTYIRWTDNQGGEGYTVKNQFHDQSYYPLWAGDELTLSGTCLPQNGIDENGAGSYFVLYQFRWGYADNAPNTDDESAIDIDWAVDANGEKVHLPGVDFIKIYTGVNQENGWLGENSTEITGVEDLHVLGIDINTRQ